jgi:hypothetical protein
MDKNSNAGDRTIPHLLKNIISGTRCPITVSRYTGNKEIPLPNRFKQAGFHAVKTGYFQL